MQHCDALPKEFMLKCQILMEGKDKQRIQIISLNIIIDICLYHIGCLAYSLEKYCFFCFYGQTSV